MVKNQLQWLLQPQAFFARLVQAGRSKSSWRSAWEAVRGIVETRLELSAASWALPAPGL